MKKHGITALILLAIVAVFYFSTTADGRIHPPKEKWLKDHGKWVIRQNKLDNCLKCHTEKSKEGYKTKEETKAKYCNGCHQDMGVAPVK